MTEITATTLDALTIGEAREAIERGKEIEKIIGGHQPKSVSSAAVYTTPQIVVLDRGFVYVGDVAVSGDWVTITNARTIRRWGTTKGLGELAKNGPLKDSILDPAGTVRAPMRALISLIECEASSWTK